MIEQPDWIEVGSSMYDCGECGGSYLDRLHVYPGENNQEVWLACCYCGWEERTPDMPTVENNWYNARYMNNA